jgi:hypothetical protein
MGPGDGINYEEGIGEDVEEHGCDLLKKVIYFYLPQGHCIS